jgi:hypothetical protein
MRVWRREVLNKYQIIFIDEKQLKPSRSPFKCPIYIYSYQLSDFSFRGK